MLWELMAWARHRREVTNLRTESCDQSENRELGEPANLRVTFDSNLYQNEPPNTSTRGKPAEEEAVAKSQKKHG